MSSVAIGTEMPLHEEARCEVGARPADVFEHIDKPERLSAHMARKSWQLGGVSMSIDTDAAGGRTVGSHISLRGRMMGLLLSVECEVVQRDPPRFKAWKTVGVTRLLVIGPYCMSVAIEPRSSGSNITIAIDYALPRHRFWRLFGPFYARWCVRQMANDVAQRFAPAS
jgi:hypothetical protein